MTTSCQASVSMRCGCVSGRLTSVDATARFVGTAEVGAVMRPSSSIVATATPVEEIGVALRPHLAITARMSHVCEVGREDYLLISPEVMWLTEDNDYSGVFEVYSNVDWIIK